MDLQSWEMDRDKRKLREMETERLGKSLPDQSLVIRALFDIAA